MDKSKFMVISKKRDIPELSVKINNKGLKSCHDYKYLGVVIDKDLSWKSHIKYICSKISKACGALAKLRHFVGIDILKNVYHALVHSYLRYGILIWGHAAQSVLKPLQVSVNRAVRIMTFAPFGSLDLKPIYKQLKILNVSKTSLLETGKFEYKARNDLLPVTIGNYFLASSDSIPQHSYNLRSSNSTAPPILLSEIKTGEKPLQFIGAQIWNGLKPEIKGCESLNAFKKAYKKFLIDSEIESDLEAMFS